MLGAGSDRFRARQFEREPKFFCPVNNPRFRRFPIGKILRHLNTTMSIGEAMKTFGTKFWKFYQKTQKLLTYFQVLRLQAVITLQWLLIAGNSLPNCPSMGCLVTIFTVTITSKSFRGMYTAHQKGTYPNFRQRPMSDIAYWNQ